MKYNSQNKQVTFDSFRSSLEDLGKSNRWVMLGDNLLWVALEKLYNSRLNHRTSGASNISAHKVIGASVVGWYTYIDHHSWDAYNEGTDLVLHVNLFKQRYGCLPSTILADKIYMNRENRKQLKDLEIKTHCKPLGRPSKEEKSEEEKALMAKAVGDRNEIECSFGTGKRVYRANNIRAKLPNTTDCWTGMCYFVKNVMKFLRELCLVLSETWRVFVIFTLTGGDGSYPSRMAAE